MKKTPPLLYDDLFVVWEGFSALSSSRVGLETIGFSEIEAWLNLNGIIDLNYRQEIAHLIRILDSEYIDLLSKRLKRERTKPCRH